MKFKRKVTSLIILLYLPLLLGASEFTVKVVETGKDLPRNFYKDWKKGDLFISDGQFLLLVGGASRTSFTKVNSDAGDVLGSILAFAPKTNNITDALVAGIPSLSVKNQRKYITYSSVTQSEGENNALLVTASADVENDELAISIRTVYKILPNTGRIELSSTIKNTGKSDLQNVNYNISFNAGTVFGFAPYNIMYHPERAYTIYPKFQHSQAWLSLDPPKGWGSPGMLKSGKSYTVRYALLSSLSTQDLMERLYTEKGVAYETATLKFPNFNGKRMEVNIRDALNMSVHYRSFLPPTPELKIPLPEGFYNVRVNFFPASVLKTLPVIKGEDNTISVPDMEKGTIHLKITNSNGEHVPGKVTFIGLDPTKTPFFMPSDPMVSNRASENFKNSRYPGEEGLTLELPVGGYLIYAARGPEYTMDKKVVEIIRGEEMTLDFVIDKVINTEHYLSVDPHMHTFFSDGTMSIAERIKSVIAEGVDVAVSTDHNIIIDYSSDLKKLNLGRYLAVIPGNEVTTGRMIHYNTYPNTPEPDKTRNGAISTHSRTAGPLFKASREQAPEAIIQVNHPRSGTMGYFSNLRLDQNKGAFSLPNFDLNFDVIEVMNHAAYNSPNGNSINDFLNFLNKGYFFPAVGSSDSHAIDRNEPGYSRTYVMYQGRDKVKKNEGLNTNAFIRAIKEGRSFVSNGPFVEVKVNGSHVQGDTFTAEQGRVTLKIKVQSAPWIDVSQVKIIINGDRRIVFNVKSNRDDIIKLEEELGLTLKEDSYIVVEVMGEKSLYPLVQAKARYGKWRANLPYALTNPVFVDVDGNGKFDPPWPGEIVTRPDAPVQKPKIERNKY